MREFWIIFKQAFLTKAKTKSFIITTIVLVLGVFVLANMNRVIEGVSNLTGGDEETPVVALTVDDEELYEKVITHQSQRPDVDFVFAKHEESFEALEKQVKDMKMKLRYRHLI